MRTWLAALAAAATLFFAPTRAVAQTLPAPRLRLGGSFGLGPLVLPAAVTLASAEAEGRVGVQVSDPLALYLHPTFAIGLGSASVALFSGGLDAEWTVSDRLAFAAGPSFGFFTTLNAGDGTSRGPRGAVLGGRGHIAFYPNYGIADHYPYNGRSTSLVNRASWSLALDVLVLTGSIGAFSAQRTSRDFLMILPTVSLGIDVY